MELLWERLNLNNSPKTIFTFPYPELLLNLGRCREAGYGLASRISQL